MTITADVVVVGAGSAGAVIAARLSEDPDCQVVLIEAGGPPPPVESMPAACPALQMNPETDWMYTADAGEAGLGLDKDRMMVPRGKMLGGSSGINYMAYVRGHPGDYDSWAAGGATGWSYDEVLPFFLKSEGLCITDEVPIDADVHNTDGPLGVSVREPVLPGAQAFVDAAIAAGIPAGDYNGRDRGGPTGLVSLMQTTTRDGKRASTYHAFLEGETEQRPNLTVVTGAHVTKIVLSDGAGSGAPRATGVEFVDSAGRHETVTADTEVILSAGSVGSPQILMLSGVGPREHLESLGITCRVDAPEVGSHLKDHLQLALMLAAPGLGVSMSAMGVSMGPDALRAPAGPLPADPADDDAMPEQLQAVKTEALRQVTEWATTGRGLPSSSLYDASSWLSTGLGDPHTHDAQIAVFVCGYNDAIWRSCLHVDPAEMFADPATTLGPDAESILVLANPVQPHSEGHIRLAEADPFAAPEISMNYYGDPHDMQVMLATVRRAEQIVAKLRDEHELGEVMVAPFLAAKHGHKPGDPLSDELVVDIARHYSSTVYHLTSTCRIGSVVDPSLRVLGVEGLRVADASVMPNVISGNTNAPTIMIGEKAAELVARDHGLRLNEFVGAGN